MASLNEYIKTLDRVEAAHLLRRCTFGPGIIDIEQFEGLTVSEAVDLFFPEGEELPSPPIDLLTSSSWVNPPIQNSANDGNSEQDDLHKYYKAWHTDVMLTSSLSLRERITWFFHSHLPARWSEIRSSEAIYYQNSLFRYYAFGSFKDLFKKICVDNAMLVYLDGNSNRKTNPNENFAREMFELYSIGKGPQLEEGNYTFYSEDDIKAATRVLTGWTNDNTFTNIDVDTGIPTGKLRFITQGNPGVDLATDHDASTKIFSSIFNQQQISPSEIIDSYPTTEAAYQELDDMIELIFAKLDTAKFIVRKLYRFFVYHFISDEVEQDIIQPLAVIFQNSGYQIPDVLKVLLKSEHFFDADNTVNSDNNIGALIKSPLDLSFGLLRFFNVNLPDKETETALLYSDMEYLHSKFEDQGLSYYEPFEVAGYPAYHQIPGYNRNWITTNSLVYRYHIGNILLGIGDEQDKLSFKIDILDWVEHSGHISDPRNPEEIVRVITSNILGVELNDDRFNFFLNTVFLDTFDPATWNYEWGNYETNGDEIVVRERLEYFLSSLTQTPEFQLY